MIRHVLLGFLFLTILVFLWNFYMSFRVDVVYKERTRIAKKIQLMNLEDMINSNFPTWRWKVLNSYNYDKMLWQLCKFKWTFAELIQKTSWEKIRNE